MSSLRGANRSSYTDPSVRCSVHTEETYDSILVKDQRDDEWKGQFSEWPHTDHSRSRYCRGGKRGGKSIRPLPKERDDLLEGRRGGAVNG